MKIKKLGKKLVLNKKTISDLTKSEMSVQRGGVQSDYCTEWQVTQCGGITRVICETTTESLNPTSCCYTDVGMTGC